MDKIADILSTSQLTRASDMMTDATTPRPEKDEDESNRYQNIAERLVSRFGLGDKPEIRRRFYRRLQHAVDLYGDRAYEQICEAVTDAMKATSPARFFCSAIKSRLIIREMDVWEKRLF